MGAADAFVEVQSSARRAIARDPSARRRAPLQNPERTKTVTPVADADDGASARDFSLGREHATDEGHHDLGPAAVDRRRALLDRQPAERQDPPPALLVLDVWEGIESQ